MLTQLLNFQMESQRRVSAEQLEALMKTQRAMFAVAQRHWPVIDADGTVNQRDDELGVPNHAPNRHVAMAHRPIDTSRVAIRKTDNSCGDS